MQASERVVPVSHAVDGHTNAIDIKSCVKKCDQGEEGDHIVSLWPKDKMPTVDHILLVVDPASYRVRASIAFDPLGNRTEYRLTDFNGDVVVADNGDIFVADGHGANTNNRVVKFSSDGTFIMSWGQTGYTPGEFRTLHAIAIDSRGRVFVGDRSNNRIQIFDQVGNVIAVWTQFGRPSGISFDDNDRIYVADSESDDVQNPGWEMGIRIGEVATGWVTEFILYPWGDPRDPAGNGAEFVAVDRNGNLYGGEPRPRRLQKYVRVRP